MPRTRTTQPREDKEQAILDAAEDRLRAGGYEALSMAGIARQLGVAQNTIYWYFGSKDDLLAGVLIRGAKQRLAWLAGLQQGDLAELLVAAARQLDSFAPLEAAMRERSPHAPVVEAFRQDFDASLHELLRGALRQHGVDDPDAVAHTFAAVVRGTAPPGVDPGQADRTRRFALDALLGAARS